MKIKYDEWIAERYNKLTAKIVALSKERSALVRFKIFRETRMEAEKDLSGEQREIYKRALKKAGLKLLYPEKREPEDFLSELDAYQQNKEGL